MAKVTSASDKYAHQKRYNSSMEDKGLCRVTVWVPSDGKDKIIKTASNLRKRANH